MENGHEDGIKYSSALSGRLQHFSQLVTYFPQIREDLVIVDNRICSRSKKWNEVSLSNNRCIKAHYPGKYINYYVRYRSKSPTF